MENYYKNLNHFEASLVLHEFSAATTPRTVGIKIHDHQEVQGDGWKLSGRTVTWHGDHLTSIAIFFYANGTAEVLMNNRGHEVRCRTLQTAKHYIRNI